MEDRKKDIIKMNIDIDLEGATDSLIRFCNALFVKTDNVSEPADNDLKSWNVQFIPQDD